jgi:hypothetical protein
MVISPRPSSLLKKPLRFVVVLSCVVGWRLSGGPGAPLGGSLPASNQIPSEPHWAHLHSDLLARQPFRDFRDQETDTSRLFHHVSINGSLVFDAGGNFTGYRGTGRDVTAEVKAARELELARKVPRRQAAPNRNSSPT